MDSITEQPHWLSRILMVGTGACHIRPWLSGSLSQKPILTDTSDEQILYLQCFSYSLLSEWVPSLLDYRGRRTQSFGCYPKHETTLQKSVKLVKRRHHILFHPFTILWNIFIYLYKHYFSIVLNHPELCRFFFQAAGANPLWCNLKLRLSCSTATPSFPKGQEGPIHGSK